MQHLYTPCLMRTWLPRFSTFNRWVKLGPAVICTQAHIRNALHLVAINRLCGCNTGHTMADLRTASPAMMKIMPHKPTLCQWYKPRLANCRATRTTNILHGAPHEPSVTPTGDFKPGKTTPSIQNSAHAASIARRYGLLISQDLLDRSSRIYSWARPYSDT